eukprot:2145506-Pyramimonas_sp.AAC.1
MTLVDPRMAWMLAPSEAFWRACRHAIGLIPARTSLVATLDANAHLPPHPPLVGHAGVRGHGPLINNNGRALMDILKDFGLAALNAFGKKGRRNGTWRSPAGAWTTIDY